jgi:F0F1-type ATP synthase beta subunit
MNGGLTMRKQTKNITIRMTEEDYIKLMARVKKSGMKQADFLRKAILNKNIVSINGVEMLIPELKRIGNNVNQIARYMNQGFYVHEDAFKLVAGELRNIWQQLRSFAQGQV